jgi:DNA-directed RNA polymerase specialized sigma24 family protein
MDKVQNNELDEQLKLLAISAQQHPPLTQGRQLAVRKLVNGIVQSGRLCRPQRGQFSGSYEDIYDEAVQELLLYICQNIEKYDPERGSVMAWVNVLLERRFFKEAIPKILGKPNLQKMTLSDLDNLAPSEETESLTEILKECIESDPDNLLKKEYLQNYPTANFQVLLQRRFSGKSWKEISAEFDINIKTLSSFYYRCVNKLSLRLREYCLTN